MITDWHNFEMQWIGGSMLLAKVVYDGEWYVSDLSCLDPISRLRIPIHRKDLPGIERAILAQWKEELDND